VRGRRGVWKRCGRMGAGGGKGMGERSVWGGVRKGWESTLGVWRLQDPSGIGVVRMGVARRGGE